MDEGGRGKHYKVIGWILNLPLTFIHWFSSVTNPCSSYPQNVLQTNSLCFIPMVTALAQNFISHQQKPTWLSLSLSSFLHANQITSTKWISAYAFLVYVLLVSYLFQFLSKNIYNSSLTPLCADLGYQPLTGVGSIHEVRTGFLQGLSKWVQSSCWRPHMKYKSWSIDWVWVEREKKETTHKKNFE